jgi:ComF family protein
MDMGKFKMLRRIGAAVREAVLPGCCALCNGALLTAAEAEVGLCDECARGFCVDDVPRCVKCGKPLISERGVCMACRRLAEAGREFAFDGAFSAFHYMGAGVELLQAYKFGKRMILSRFFARTLVESGRMAGVSDAVWVPVPPRPGKIKATGWDQMETIARVLERQHGYPVSRCLERLPSRSQKELDGKTRLTNLIGKIRSIKTPPASVILFDDLRTTGATLSICAETLKAAGTRKVYVMSLFYTN